MRTEDDSLYVFGMSKLVTQPVQQLGSDSLLAVNAYSDDLIYTAEGGVHRLTSDGDRGSVSLGADATANKEFVMAFAASEHQVSFLMRDKQNTPTVNGGCADLGSVQSAQLGKYTIANEHGTGNQGSNAGRGQNVKPIMTNSFQSRQERDQ